MGDQPEFTLRPAVGGGTVEERDYDAEMKLPPGKTCGDCRHVKRCRAFGFTSSESNTNCDFHPNRFIEATHD